MSGWQKRQPVKHAPDPQRIDVGFCRFAWPAAARIAESGDRVTCKRCLHKLVLMPAYSNLLNMRGIAT